MSSTEFDWETVAKMAGELLGGTDLVKDYYLLTPMEWFEWFQGELKDMDLLEKSE